VDGPGAHFVRPGRKVAVQAKGGVAGVDDAYKAAFINAVGGEQFRLFLIGQALQFFFKLGANARKAGLAFLGKGFKFGGKFIALGNGGFIHIGAVNNGLGREQAKFAPCGQKALVIRQVKSPRGLAVVELGQQGLHDFCGCLGVFVKLGKLLQLVQALFNALQVGQQQFGFNGVHIPQGINAAVHVGDIFILKAAHYMHNGRAFANVAQKLVAQPFTLACAAYQTCNVDKINTGVNGLLGLGLGGQGIHPLVRHRHRGLVGFNGAEGVVGGLGILGLGQGVEKGGFANVGQAHNTNTERHVVSLLRAKRRIARSGRRARAGLAASKISGPGSRIVTLLPRRARRNY